MHVFVTGGAGYIGSINVEQLLDAGHTVTVFDNLTEGHRAAVDPRATLLIGDLQNRCDIEDAMERAKPDAVMHFAANALVGESMTNPSKYFRNNVAAGINLLDAMVAVGCKKFVFSSTCATFGIPERVPIDETTPQAPINPYGESKLMFEKVLRWYDEIHGIRHVALRYFNAAGASGRYGEDHRIETHLIPNILKVALGQKEHVEIYGTDYPTPDGTCIRDYIHILDLAAAHMLALDFLVASAVPGGACAVPGGACAVPGGAPAVPGGACAVPGGAPAVPGGAPAVPGGAPAVPGGACAGDGARYSSARFNLGTGGGTSVREVISACEAVSGKSIAVVEKPRRPGDPPRLIAGSDKIKTELGWAPKFQDIRAIVDSAWKWHVANPNGYGD